MSTNIMYLHHRLTILDQIARYSHAFDNQDLDAFIEIFTSDGIFEMFAIKADKPELQLKSQTEIRQWITHWHETTDNDCYSRHHQSGTLFLHLTGTQARTSTMLLSTIQNPKDPSPQVKLTGIYYDNWRKTPDGWRIKHRTLRHDQIDSLNE